jgi:TonB family protein
MAFLALLVASSAALSPVDGWTVMREDQRSCIATRYYGDPGAPSRAQLTVVPGEDYAATLTIRFAPDWSQAPIGILPPNAIPKLPLSALAPSAGSGTLSLTGSSNKSYTVKVAYGVDGFNASPWIQATVERDYYDALLKAKTARIDVGNGKSAEIALGDFGGVEPLLEKCRLHVLHEWGIDPALLVPAPETAGGWFTDDDYPAPAKRRGAQGRVIAAFDGAPDGTVRSCRVVMTSGDSDLDATTCSIVLTRGSLAPNKRASRIAIVSINWTLQDD